MDTFNKPSLLIFGKNGQLAKSFAELLPEATLLSSEDCNFNKPDEISAAFDNVNPTLVINCSAYTAVDNAEDEKESAMQVNAYATESVAKHCADRDIPLVHFSTDYVFGDSKDTAYVETDTCQPLNVYGESKWLGEKLATAASDKVYIFRISWVFSPWGKNFPKTMIHLAKDKEELNIVNDQHGSPCYAPHVASAVLEILGQPANYGVYHLTPQDTCSWYDLAKYTINKYDEAHPGEIKVQKIGPTDSSQFPTKATRPKNSVLDTRKFRSTFNITLPSWKEGVDNFLERLK